MLYSPEGPREKQKGRQPIVSLLHPIRPQTQVHVRRNALLKPRNDAFTGEILEHVAVPIALDHLTLLSLEVLRRFLVAKLDGSLDFKTRQRDGTQLRHFFLGRVQPGTERKRVVVDVRGYLLLVGLRARLQIAWWRRNIRIRLEKDQPHNTVQYNTIHTIQYNVIQYNVIQYNI